MLPEYRQRPDSSWPAAAVHKGVAGFLEDGPACGAATNRRVASPLHPLHGGSAQDEDQGQEGAEGLAQSPLTARTRPFGGSVRASPPFYLRRNPHIAALRR